MFSRKISFLLSRFRQIPQAAGFFLSLHLIIADVSRSKMKHTHQILPTLSQSWTTKLHRSSLRTPNPAYKRQHEKLERKSDITNPSNFVPHAYFDEKMHWRHVPYVTWCAPEVFVVLKEAGYGSRTAVTRATIVICTRTRAKRQTV